MVSIRGEEANVDKTFRRCFIYIMLAQLYVIAALLILTVSYGWAAWPFLSGYSVGAVSPGMTGFSWARWYQLLAAAIYVLLVTSVFSLYLYKQFRKLVDKFRSGQTAAVSDYVSGKDLNRALRRRFILLIGVLAVAVVAAFSISWRFGMDIQPYLFSIDAELEPQVEAMTFRKNLIDTLFLIPFSSVFGSSFAFVTM